MEMALRLQLGPVFCGDDCEDDLSLSPGLAVVGGFPVTGEEY